MNRLSLFVKLQRKKQPEGATLFLLFSTLAAAVSMVLFVQGNNTYFFQSQLAQAGFPGGAEGFSAACRSVENTLGIIAVAAVFIGTAGSLGLIGFRNRSSEKSVVMMRIFGMQKKDLVVKALLDAAVYGFWSACAGFCCGYLLFLHFSQKIFRSDELQMFASFQTMALFSLQSLIVFCETLVLVVFLVFSGNLYIDFRMAEQPVVQVIYRRKGSGKRHGCMWVLVLQILGILLCSLLVFHVNKGHLAVAGVAAAALAAVLFAVFHLLFHIVAKRRRDALKVRRAGDLSFCFLCSRNKRDAALSVIISAGTIFLCMAANICFNLSGMLRSAYQDNMGYTALVRVDDFGQREQVRKCLDENGITYTSGCSRLMDYSRLNHMGGTEGKFWALVIDGRTDENGHFDVPRGTFLAEDYFVATCGIAEGQETELFGGRASCLGSLEDNQYLSLVSYSFIINEEDWKLGVDDSWSAIFLMDVSPEEEREAGRLLSGLPCHMESASELIDEIREMMSDYLDILMLVAGMTALVTAAIFYTVIRSDLAGRRTEIYLYRVYGASFAKARRVIFYEYMLIALVSSFAVSFSVTVCGELYFYFGLGKHFPLSLPVTAATTALAAGFVFLCCQAAGYVGAKGAGAEIIRDE